MQHTILVVDDEPTNLRVLNQVLANQYRLIFAKNGQEALSMLEQHPIDLVFMDIQMPIMDGLEATSEIRKNFLPTELPIIAMTANAMKEDHDASQSVGMNDHIDKPISPENLFSTLLKWNPLPSNFAI